MSHQIRPMRAGDVARAADAVRRAEFGEREQFFAWAVEQPSIAPFVGVAGDDIVATGIASAHGHAGWVGVIFVAPAHRGSGLGRAITRVVIEELERRGCRTQILIASPMGRPIYEREGFRVLAQHVRFTAPANPPADHDAGIRPSTERDLEDILAIDRASTGEDRSAVLRRLVSPASTWVARSADDRARGYFVRPPWRGGAVVAPDPDDVVSLLELRRRMTGPGGHAGAAVVDTNEVGRQRLRDAGWIEERANARMIRGEPLDWNPHAIYGVLNGALG